jgi:hypothetical protein
MRRLCPPVYPVAIGLAILGCGSSPQTALTGSGNSTSSGAGGDASADGSGGIVGPIAASDSGPTFISFAGDSSTTQSFNCKPGTYTGPFSTKVTMGGDAGGLLGLLASLFQYPWMGTLSITLVGMTTFSGTGENDYSTLTIAPGAQLSGVDQTGGHFQANISGTLDCATNVLTGTLSNGSYEFPGDAGSLSMQGTISATYGEEGDAGTPALSGDLTASSQQLQGTEAAGTWSAALQ